MPIKKVRIGGRCKEILGKEGTCKGGGRLILSLARPCVPMSPLYGPGGTVGGAGFDVRLANPGEAGRIKTAKDASIRALNAGSRDSRSRFFSSSQFSFKTPCRNRWRRTRKLIGGVGHVIGQRSFWSARTRAFEAQRGNGLCSVMLLHDFRRLQLMTCSTPAILPIHRRALPFW